MVQVPQAPLAGMRDLIITNIAREPISELLFEVSVYECGCSLCFISVGSNVV
jgi:hypothetical protein